MQKTAIAALVAVTTCLVTIPIQAQSGGADLRTGTTAEVRIGLPEGPASAVSVKPSQEQIVLELPEDASLQSVRCETWGAWVFVNLDADAEPLTEFLGEAGEHRHLLW